MSDERLRELERRWKETRAVQDEAACLSERVRSGNLDRERLRLAAYLGNEASREALGEGSWSLADYRSRLLSRASMGDFGADSDYLMAYLGDESKREPYGIGPGYWPSTAREHDLATLEIMLIEWSQQALVRALLAIAWTTRPIWESVPAEVLESYPESAGSALSDALDAAEAWLSNPSDDTAGTAFGAADTAGIVAARGQGNWSKAAFLVSSAAYASAQEKFGSTLGERLRGLLSAERLLGSEVLHDAIASELVPYLLGYSDPVRERVEARQREAAGE